MTKQTHLSKMIEIVAEAHKNQFDKGGVPYIFHPISVMDKLNTQDEELKCIAIGHDLIEDTYVTVDILRCCGFTERIIRGIQALTHNNGADYDLYKLQVFANIDAMRVKLCDLEHNADFRRLKGVTEEDFRRMEKYQQFYFEIRERLAQRVVNQARI